MLYPSNTSCSSLISSRLNLDLNFAKLLLAAPSFFKLRNTALTLKFAKGSRS